MNKAHVSHPNVLRLYVGRECLACAGTCSWRAQGLAGPFLKEPSFDGRAEQSRPGLAILGSEAGLCKELFSPGSASSSVPCLDGLPAPAGNKLLLLLETLQHTALRRKLGKESSEPVLGWHRSVQRQQHRLHVPPSFAQL